MFPISTLILFGSLAAPTCCKKTKTGRGGQYIHTNDTDTDLTGVQMWGGNWGHGNWNHQWGGQSRGSGPTHSAPPVNGHSARPVVITTSTPPVVQNTGTDTVPTMSTAQPPPEPSQSSTGGGGSGPTGAGGAAGVGVDGSSGLDASSFTGINWYFDWDVNALPNMGSLEYVPNVHGQAQVSTVKAASAKWQGVKYVLGFNERQSSYLGLLQADRHTADQSTSVGGSGIDAQTAATLHQQWVSDLGGSYSIGTPAVARGGKQWMTDWIAACNGKCKFDFVAFHFYGTDANDLISYAQVRVGLGRGSLLITVGLLQHVQEAALAHRGVYITRVSC